jgi:hypothetical protein
MVALAIHNWASAAVGIAIAIALIRGFAARNASGIGNFWADVVRCTIYLLLPIALVSAVVFIALGVPQNQRRGFPQLVHVGADLDCEVGLVQKRWSGLANEMFTDADNFGVDLSGVTDPRLKLLAFAAVVLIDIVHFEKAKN